MWFLVNQLGKDFAYGSISIIKNKREMDCFDPNQTIESHFEEIFKLIDDNEENILKNADPNIVAEYIRMRDDTLDEYEFWKKSGTQTVMVADLLIKVTNLAQYITVLVIAKEGD